MLLRSESKSLLFQCCLTVADSDDQWEKGSSGLECSIIDRRLMSLDIGVSSLVLVSIHTTPSSLSVYLSFSFSVHNLSPNENDSLSDDWLVWTIGQKGNESFQTNFSDFFYSRGNASNTSNDERHKESRFRFVASSVWRITADISFLRKRRCYLMWSDLSGLKASTVSFEQDSRS